MTRWHREMGVSEEKHRAMLIAVDKCLAWAPCIEVRSLENIYEILVESRMLYGVEILGIYEAWKQMMQLNMNWEETVTRTVKYWHQVSRI
jgi:hypothetical protein